MIYEMKERDWNKVTSRKRKRKKIMKNQLSDFRMKGRIIKMFSF